ncbi:MAG: hypothetical protein ACRDHL_07085 [Candidatus Promineifilaceae bacterium]
MSGRSFLIVVALGATLVLSEPIDAQTGSGAVALTIRLRASDGAPVAGEPVTLERLPHEEEVLPECETDAAGRCTWHVARGLYQVLFERPLDDVSALALAEGGLRGFGLTAGEAPITYHFTFHSDGRVYFDAAPEAAAPSPIIPTPELLHGGIAPTPTTEATVEPEPAETQPAGRQPDDEDENPSVDQKEEPNSRRRWQVALFIALGLAVGGGLHLWSWHKDRPAPRGKAKEPPDA